MLTWLRDGLGFLTAALAGRVATRRHPLWRKVRAAHLKREPDCQACGSRWFVQVHHVVPVHVDRSRELDATNLLTLCEVPGPGGCHLKWGHGGRWSGVNPNVREDCARLRAARLTSPRTS